MAWGGRGDAPGRFQTAHGIFAHDGRIIVANREAHQARSTRRSPRPPPPAATVVPPTARPPRPPPARPPAPATFAARSPCLSPSPRDDAALPPPAVGETHCRRARCCCCRCLFTPEGQLVRCLPDIPMGARICNARGRERRTRSLPPPPPASRFLLPASPPPPASRLLPPASRLPPPPPASPSRLRLPPPAPPPPASRPPASAPPPASRLLLPPPPPLRLARPASAASLSRLAPSPPQPRRRRALPDPQLGRRGRSRTRPSSAFRDALEPIRHSPARTAPIHARGRAASAEPANSAYRSSGTCTTCGRTRHTTGSGRSTQWLVGGQVWWCSSRAGRAALGADYG